MDIIRTHTTDTTQPERLVGSWDEKKMGASTSAPIQVAIGILARNEAKGIAALLQDIGNQSLLDDPNLSIHLTVVANGCSDDTAEAARQALEGQSFKRIRTSICEIDRPGKANAWNEFVHRILRQDTEFVFFLDGDIRIPQTGDLGLILRSLQISGQAVVAVDRSVKDLELEAPKSLSEWLIKKGTGSANDTRTAIAGALYCVKYSAIRNIWMPLGLPGEDGFLRAMLLTSSFAHEEELERHVFVAEAYHVFESTRDARSVVQHNVRLAIGTAINILLFGELRRVRSQGEEIAEYVKRRNLADPDWVNELVRERLRTSYFPLQPRFLLRRLGQRRSWRSLRSIVIALFGTGFDLVVFGKATRLMRKGAGAGYW